MSSASLLKTVMILSTGDWMAHKGKVFSICLVVNHEGCEDLVSCGPDGEMVVSNVGAG